MKTLQVLMPMAGLGSRFVEEGFKEPKPLIEIDGKPMFMKAISSLNNIPFEKKYICVIRRELQDKFCLADIIKKEIDNSAVISINIATRGAAETSYKASSVLDRNSPLIILDCDLWFKSKEYETLINDVLNKKKELGGALLTFYSESPKYSYAKTYNGEVIETAEKRLISDRAIVGAYFFGKAEYFLTEAREMIKKEPDSDSKEFYVSLVYNSIIKKGLTVKESKVDQYFSFGTPEEFRQYNLIKDEY